MNSYITLFAPIHSDSLKAFTCYQSMMERMGLILNKKTLSFFMHEEFTNGSVKIRRFGGKGLEFDCVNKNHGLHYRLNRE